MQIPSLIEDDTLLKYVGPDKLGIGTSALRLIYFAECLFAKYGLEKTSLRMIAKEAGNKNNNAVRYHFGDKFEIIKAIHNLRVLQMEPMRREILEDWRRLPENNEVEILLKAMCLPQISFVNHIGMHGFVHFNNQFLLRSSPFGSPNNIKMGNLGLPHPIDNIDIDLPVIRDIVYQLCKHIDLPTQIQKASRISLVILYFLNSVIRSELLLSNEYYLYEYLNIEIFPQMTRMIIYPRSIK